MTDQSIEINDIFFANERFAYLSYSYVDHPDKVFTTKNPNLTLSLVSGAYTTMHARLRLYDELYNLGDRLLYCDTDSNVYIETDDTNEYRPTLGPNIGDLASEIPPGCEIIGFVAVGPKSYSLQYRHNDGTISEKTKLKGFVSTSETKTQLSFNNFKKMVFGCVNENSESGILDSYTIETKRKVIGRKKYFNVITSEQTKRFGFTFDKRIVLDDYSTIPFGYRQK